METVEKREGVIYFVSGPPGAGKTTLCMALMDSVEFGFHLPLDDLRLWVKAGLADSVPWTDDTERQFQLAEKAGCAIARTYADAGFIVAIDHCRNPQRLDALVAQELDGYLVRRIMLMPELEKNLQRNRVRTNKSFDPRILEDTIRDTNSGYRNTIDLELWRMVDNSSMTVAETLAVVAGS